MGNFHCVPSGCAQVRYKPYRKAGGLRYRYPGENWITIDGDDWSINEVQGAGNWKVFCNAISMSRDPVCSKVVTFASRDYISGRIINIKIDSEEDVIGKFIGFKTTYVHPSGIIRTSYDYGYYSSEPGYAYISPAIVTFAQPIVGGTLTPTMTINIVLRSIKMSEKF